MTNAELIAGLRECATVGDCRKCKMHDEYSYDMCAIKLLLAAADALEADEKRIAELMPKEGEWQWLSSTYDRVPCEMRYVCSVCHHQEITHYDKPWKHYCPNCGAKMKRGEHDGET